MIHVFDHPLGFREPIPAGDDEVPVFSFGANMSRASLRSRGVAVSDKEPVKATLEDYELVFNSAPVRTVAYEGHYGNIRPKEGSKVHGVVVWFPRVGLEELDKREGPSYDRRWSVVVPYDASLQPLPSMVYIQTQSFPSVSILEDGLPGRRYLMTLVTGADRVGLSSRWVEHLRTLPYRSFEQFDWDADRRLKEQLLRREYTPEEVVATHDGSVETLLVSLLGVVILLPTDLREAELNVFKSFEDLTIPTAVRVAYEPPPTDILLLTPEQRGFVETILCSFLRFPGAQLMGHLPDYRSFWSSL
ncbi:hypothetical protein Pmar_PMAR005661 [Perkinsus marinus ATCC 50983]|uniref:Gamma-glutamylcyclotransferase AIG2-like domain-containing protein n=1 Tax=Perkinsus marinus (strain ATCC 50983 / TXsc) TaxID=423536 RepID=C5M0Y6_PERM5|nr:hypothetical protein Pmar_PMAR005661 [Perkinsus marinus ATCC 50983]EEQ97354.1 hypothetical protein Pmar_PMAR005661 [Perkinsus marinus ATCC 50983]|eukprot:XP_002764637.1 hypothetical protein Pmar_PMAR005661 [Perkinsus marinus ATCC 50983]